MTILSFKPNPAAQNPFKIAIFYLSQAPGLDRQIIILPDGVKCFLRVEFLPDDARQDVESALDFARPLEDEVVLNTSTLFLGPDPQILGT